MCAVEDFLVLFMYSFSDGKLRRCSIRYFYHICFVVLHVCENALIGAFRILGSSAMPTSVKRFLSLVPLLRERYSSYE